MACLLKHFVLIILWKSYIFLFPIFVRIMGLFIRHLAMTLQSKMERQREEIDTFWKLPFYCFFICKFQKDFGGNVVLTVCFLINPLPSNALNNQSPFCYFISISFFVFCFIYLFGFWFLFFVSFPSFSSWIFACVALCIMWLQVQIRFLFGPQSASSLGIPNSKKDTNVLIPL